MKMTRQHFVALVELTADIQRDLNLTKDQAILVEDLVLNLCKESNSNFDQDRWMVALHKNLNS